MTLFELQISSKTQACRCKETKKLGYLIKNYLVIHC